MPVSLHRRAILAMTLAAATSLAAAQSTSFPERTVRIMVGYAAGGGIDTMARILAQNLSTELGQSVVVENRAGAAGMLAADAVAKSAPDGYNLLMGETSLLIAPHLQQKAVLDPLKDLTPVAGLFESQLMVVANNDFPASNPKELVEVIKANPDKFTYATSGIGSIHHMGFELMKARAGLSILHVPYRGASQLIPDIVSNQVQLGVVSAAAGKELTQSGRMKAVAMLTVPDHANPTGVAPLADVLPGFDVGPLQVLYAPAGTPPEVVARLTKAVQAVLAKPEVARDAAQHGVSPAYVAPAELAKSLARESAEWAQLIKDQNIRSE